MNYAEIVRSWPTSYQSIFWKLVDWEDYRPAEARAFVEELMRREAQRKAA